MRTMSVVKGSFGRVRVWVEVRQVIANSVSSEAEKLHPFGVAAFVCQIKMGRFWGSQSIPPENSTDNGLLKFCIVQPITVEHSLQDFRSKDQPVTGGT